MSRSLSCSSVLLSLVLVSLVSVAMLDTGEAYYLPLAGDSDTLQAIKRDLTQVRTKRYSEYQERASAFCTGMCMYEQRQPYSQCYDYCNWPQNYPKLPTRPRNRRPKTTPPPTTTTTTSTTTTPAPVPLREQSLINDQARLLRMGIPPPKSFLSNPVETPQNDAVAATQSSGKGGRRRKPKKQRKGKNKGGKAKSSTESSGDDSAKECTCRD
nr:QERAS [Urechis unicinctus]